MSLDLTKSSYTESNPRGSQLDICIQFRKRYAAIANTRERGRDYRPTLHNIGKSLYDDKEQRRAGVKYSGRRIQTTLRSYQSRGGVRRLANGGGERVRTVDLRLAKPALSQLSYTPDLISGSSLKPQASETPEKWWARVDLNYRPHAYQACALTS